MKRYELAASYLYNCPLLCVCGSVSRFREVLYLRVYFFLIYTNNIPKFHFQVKLFLFDEDKIILMKENAFNEVHLLVFTDLFICFLNGSIIIQESLMTVKQSR